MVEYSGKQSAALETFTKNYRINFGIKVKLLQLSVVNKEVHSQPVITMSLRRATAVMSNRRN